MSLPLQTDETTTASGVNFRDLLLQWYKDELGPLHSHIGTWSAVDNMGQPSFIFNSACFPRPARYSLAWCFPGPPPHVELINWKCDPDKDRYHIWRDPSSGPPSLIPANPEFFENLKSGLIIAHNSLSQRSKCTI
jgi:hypothetical protein